MNYGGNMPDWHQYNTSQTNEVTPSTQNVNSGHLAYIPGVSPSALNAISLNSEGLNKHQNNTNYNPRNYQSFNNVSNNSAIPNNSPLASMVQMQNCIGHYGSPNTRNPMLDNINASVDPRNTTIGTVNDDIGYRSNQGPFNGPIGHLNGPNCNLNVSTGPRTGPGPVHGSRTNSGPGLGTNPNTGTGPGPMYGPNSRHGPASVSGSGSGPGNMGPRGTNVGPPQPPGKPGPSSSCIPCKGMCCNSDPNINYQQWEKFGSYQNNGSYRDNVHPSNYQIENRHFGNNCNFRKDNLDGKEVMGPVMPNASTADHRRNFADYKYHKDHLAHRNYSTSSGMFHNYSMQGYNYSTEHQKYPYPVKEHAKTNNMNVQNSGMLKHQEQNFIAQQKFNSKQFQYQNGNMIPKGISALNVNANMASSSQNPYFNSQYPRNISTEISHECQETTDNASMMNRMQGTLIHNSPSQHQVYQQKIAMQKFSIENHLRELGRIPGYQSHPKYKECILRYREILKLQQSSGYQSPVQQIPRVATPANTSMPPINLQFDQNGMLINSSYLPDNFPKLQHASTVEQAPENIDRQNKDQDIVMANEKCQQSQQSEQLMIPQQNEHVPSSCAETFQKQSQFSIHKDYNQNQLKVQTSESHSFNILSTNSSNETMQQKTSKEFANKPDLDVRQFLANWDETDDEEGTTNLPDTILSETTPVVVVSYENIDLSSKTQQGAEVTRKTSFCSDETLESGKDGKTSIIRAQDCLTISYSSSDNSEIPKTTGRTIREGVVKPGSIIHCISNGPDEIPTIHIVDNLEISNILGTPNDQVIQTLEKQKAIPFFRESSNSETMALEDTEQQDKDSVHILPANYTTSLSNVDKDTNIEDSNISETPTISMNNQELRVLSTSQKDNLGVSHNMELKKQHSFEESHNPDDISLPDLPECTPISTTLNTPIHSDTEESSQNMEDLSISTNPIEVMQNSPVISFTQLNSENSDSKVKSISLGTIELEFQKENRYKNNEHANSEHMQEVGNFELSGNSKAKSNEAIKNKQLKNLGINAVRKKVCLIDGKESNTKILDTCAVLTSMEYELDIRQKVVESEKNSDRDSSDYTREKEHKSVSRSTEAIKHGVQRSESDDNIGSNMNISPTVSDNESQASKSDKEMLRRRKVKTWTVSTNTNCLIPSELDLNIRKRAKEAATAWDDKCIDRDLSQKRDADHLKQSKVSDARKFDDSSSSQGGEHSACHTTSQYKHHSAAVIKDILNDKKTHGVADRITNEKSPELPSKMNTNTNTKDLPEGVEIRKRACSRTISTTLHESIQSQTSRLLQKDLKGVDGDVRYTAEEMRLLKQYRKKKDKLYQACNAHDDNKNEKTISKSHKLADKICLEQNSLSSLVSLNSENLATQDEAKSHSCPKSLIKNTDFGIQVANVNLKIKDNDIGKELILGEKSQEHAKDPLEGIKIEINVSCTDRNVKGQEQNKRLLYEIDDSLSRSNTLTDCQRKLHAKEQASSNSLSERADCHKAFEKPGAMVDVVETNQGKREAEKNLRITIKQKDRRTSPEANEQMDTIVIPKEACSLIAESQPYGKSSRGNMFFKDISKATEVTKDTDRAIDHHLDVTKSKSAISNTGAVDAANNKAKGKNKPEDDEEGNRAREDDDRSVRMQKQTSSTSFINISGVMEKEAAREVIPHSKASVKLPEGNLVELRNKSLNNLNNLDMKFGRCCPELDLDRDHRRVVEELDEEKYYTGRWKKPKIDDILEDCDVFQSSSGYVNPIFSSIDKLENLHTVPVYTTKDGKISYSPNRRFTYHELMMEARRRESYPSVKKDTWNSYYSSKFRKMNKRKRHHDVSDKKKYEYKNTKCLYDRKKNYSDEFYGKNHVKCKDYIHSIRNDNAIWSDHCKMDKMYSSSDSDDQIIDRSKNHITEMNNSKKDQIIEKKGVTISKLQKDDIFINELDLESKSKENVADDPLNKDKDTDLGETQMIQLQILDMEENNENCKNVNNNCADNSSGQSDVPSTSVQLIQEKQTVEYIYSVNESPMLNDSAIASENVQTVEDKSPSNQTIDKIETLNEIESDEKNVVTKIELLDKASLLDEQVSLRDPERRKDDGKIISEVDIKEQEAEQKEQRKEININVSDSRAFLESENSFENIEDTESNNNKSETNQVDMVGILEFENDITKKVLNPQTDFNNMFDQVSQESLDLERPNGTFNEIVEESEENISEENVLECEEEIVQFSEEVEIPNEDVVNKVEKEDNEYLENSNNDNLSRDTSAMNQEEFESQAILTEKIIDQGDDSKHISVEPIQHQDNIDTHSDQINTITEEKNLTDFSKTEIYFEHENITNNITDIVSNKGEIEVILSNIEEISVKEIITDRLKNEGEPNDLPTILEHETKSDQDSFEDKEMHILDTCCSIKNSLIADVESSKDKTEVDEQKEEIHIPLEQVPCKNLAHFSDSNIDMKAIPKLVIKKTDTANSKSACSLDYTETSENCDKYDAKLSSELHPKIPKVIITKNRSRSATPVENFQKTKSDKTQFFLPEQNDESMDVDNSSFESYTLKYNNCENKVPKVRIKLEDISSKDLKMYLKRKDTKRRIPKMRIKKLKTQESKRIETKDSSGTEGSTDSDEDKNFHELMSSDTEIERTPKSKLKKQEDRSWSPEKNKGKNSNISKKTKKTKEEDSKHTAKYDTAISDELKKKFPQCIIEKIPKVIIKRTQIGTEFKCEISKSKKTSIIETSKWQPKVKLQRLDVLDHMVKDLKQSRITLSDTFDLSTRMKNINNEDIIDNSKVRLSRSNSVSNLSPAKYKQRRFSDSSYMKVNTKSNIEFKNNSDETDNAAIFKSDESKNIRKKEKRKIFSESKQLNHSQNNESESEMGEIITKHSFQNILTNEDNDMMVVKKEYSSFDTKESTPLIEDKFLDAAIRSHNYNDNNSSIIKVDSSDESQTTIEILPASPNSSDDEAKNFEFESFNRMDMTDAMPTQLELELELIDNNNTCSEVFMSEIDYASHSKSKYSNEEPTKTFFNEFQRSSQNTFDQNKYTFLMKKQQFEQNTNDNFYCNDLLIKEVLAAKETLKKCLTRSETEDVERSMSQPKTVAEKKQGLSFSFKDLGKSSDKSEETCFSSQNNKMKIGDFPCDMETEEVEEDCFKQHEIYSIDCPTVSTHRNSNVPDPTTISLKSSKTSINNSDLSNKRNSNVEKLQETKSVKKINSSSDSQKNNDNSNNTKVKENNMPLLVPEFVLNFDSSSDRDSSRSPPVITNQEGVEHVVEDAKLMENKVISQIEKIEENKKHSYKNCEMTIADIITQLAYHEKATIKHKKYCNLCERWFPTTSRHRRHLAGYQHRYMELTQRKSIHALFILFTGKPCPRLLPANVIRNDCSIGELTPLQIAVQDVAKCVEYIQQSHKTKE